MRGFTEGEKVLVTLWQERRWEHRYAVYLGPQPEDERFAQVEAIIPSKPRICYPWVHYDFLEAV